MTDSGRASHERPQAPRPSDGEPNDFAAWLRSIMRVRRIGQRQLARKAGVHHSTISRLVNGDRTPSLGTATRLAEALAGVEGGYTLTRMDRPAKPSSPASVEQVLRSDPYLSEAGVEAVLQVYRAARTAPATSAARIHRVVDGRPARGLRKPS